jgi:uncharacterized lipoprotein
MKIITRSTLCLLALSLAGCSYFSSASNSHTRDKSYLTSRSIPPLRIPPGVSSSQIHNEYPVSIQPVN